MDAAKGPRERLVYPAVCWAADDYAEAFRTVVVHPGQTVCTELVAVWPSSSTVEDNADDVVEMEYSQDSDDNLCHRNSVNIPQKQNRAVLFAGAIPYAAVRATYECKMSLYREAERQRRQQRHKQQKRGKKSSLCAALSASLTALITGGSKDSAAQGCSSDYGDYDYNNHGSGATSTERVEYVTVRGCRPLRRWDDGEGKCDLSPDYENVNCSCNGMDFDDVHSRGTKGMAQMAVALAAVQPPETETTCVGHREDFNGEFPRRQYYAGAGAEVDDGANAEGNFGYGYYDDVDDRYRQLHQQQTDYASSPFAGTATASEPGDFYDYGWDYETATAAGGSGQQTPQTPSHQKQRLDRQRRRSGRPRRLSDPCSTSLFDLIDGDDDQQQYQQLPYNTTTNVYGESRNHRKQKHNYNYYGHQQPSEYYGIAAAVATPGRTQYPNRAWSESEGLDQYGGSGWSYSGYDVPVKQQRKQHKWPLLMPPPPVPYYCAAEAAASGFIQYVRKSPGGWWMRRKNRQQRRRTKSKKTASQQRKDVTATAITKNHRRRRSASAGGNVNHSSCCSTTDDECNSINDSDSCSDSANEGGGDSTSDDQDSDGEFIGALAAAATVGTDPYREWSLQRSSGDPVVDWERCDSDSDSVVTVDNYDDDDNNLVEWTNEIVATDLRRKRLFRKGSISSRLPDNDYNFCGKPPPQIPAPSTAVHCNLKNQHQNFNITSNQKNRRRRQPQFRPQPLELPPPPPALSVAFTVIACPWWTVLEDVLLVTKTTTSDSLSSSNKSIMGLPLLTFD
ncbi:Hypothetical protein CINCED_3A013429 [Cinara cedri]|nr:Hypothetical protein CINCED_3A013429 [Cinara cedri]